MRILVGFIFVIVGALITIKSEWMLASFGRIATFEKFIKTEGGSRLFYKLFGILGIFFGFMMITNLHKAFLLWLLTPLFGRLFQM